jgi:hypothetical protein
MMTKILMQCMIGRQVLLSIQGQFPEARSMAFPGEIRSNS